MLDRLKTENMLWWGVIIFGLIFVISVVFAAFLVGDVSGSLGWTAYVREHLADIGLLPAVNFLGYAMQDDTIYAITVGITFTAISTATIYIFKINNIRKIAIRAIAYGYFENFLIRLVQHCAKTHIHYRIVIIRPTFHFVEYPDIYMDEIRSRLKKLGFVTSTETTDSSFDRHSIIVQRPGSPPVPLFVDVPTTLKTLRMILELEADMPAGRVMEYKWWRDRFHKLCGEFEDVLKQKFPSNSWRNLIFLDSENLETLEKEIIKLIEALEVEMNVE